MLNVVKWCQYVVECSTRKTSRFIFWEIENIQIDSHGRQLISD